jgi:hypothetical protein
MGSKADSSRGPAETILEPQQTILPSMFGTDAASIAWRGEQAHVDADIAGLARDQEAESLVVEMDRAGIPLDAQRERLIAYYRARARTE